MLKNPRFIFAASFAMCAGLVGFGLVLQHAKGLEPCPMCILQRYAFVAIAAIALIAAIHNPRQIGRSVYGGLLALSAIAGGGVAMLPPLTERDQGGRGLLSSSSTAIPQ